MQGAVKLDHFWMGFHLLWLKVEHSELLQGSRATQRHVSLPELKAPAQVDFQAIDGHPLRLVNGNGPRKLQWQLRAFGHLPAPLLNCEVLAANLLGDESAIVGVQKLDHRQLFTAHRRSSALVTTSCLVVVTFRGVYKGYHCPARAVHQPCFHIQVLEQDHLGKVKSLKV